MADSQRIDVCLYVRFVYTAALEINIPKILGSYPRPEEAAMHSEQLYNSLAKSSMLHPPCHFHAYGRAIQPKNYQLLAGKDQKRGMKREVSHLCKGCLWKTNANATS